MRVYYYELITFGQAGQMLPGSRLSDMKERCLISCLKNLTTV